MDSNLLKMYQRLNLPELYWEVSMSHVPDKPYKEKINDWIVNIKDKLHSGKGLFLYGDFRHGKSALAAMILRAALARGVFGLWVNYRDLVAYKVDKIKFDEYETFYERMLNVDLLVIDELEFRLNKHYDIDVLENIVRSRHLDKKVTIVTTNHSLKYLNEMKDDAEKDTRKLSKLLAGFVAILPEAFEPVFVSGRNFSKNPVK